jgi:hypothetical protein
VQNLSDEGASGPCLAARCVLLVPWAEFRASRPGLLNTLQK